MLSQESAATDTIRFNSEVAARVKMCEVGVIEITVPDKAESGIVETPEGRLDFLQFPRFVNGGMINFFVHTEDLSLRGKKTKASASVMRKEFADGRSFLYVDLKPLPWQTETTRRLVILDIQPGQQFVGTDRAVIETPAPLRGAIILMDPGAKVASPQFPSMSSTKAYAPKKSDDPQLDRLLADGWTIKEDHGSSVTLSKMKKGVPNTMTHHRPKRRN